jgi:hypothetical protein
MEEVFPVLAGVVVGLAIHAIGSRAVRALIVALGSLGFGALASWISGELAVSVVYVAIDVAQVAGTAVLTAMLAVAWRRRALRVRS